VNQTQFLIQNESFIQQMGKGQGWIQVPHIEFYNEKDNVLFIIKYSTRRSMD